jgi:hypothetical protein
MGVLDDAIREHLELKRQHGAEEAEVRRQEEEALGPARREVAPAETGEDAAAVEPGAEAPQAEQEQLPEAHADELAMGAGHPDEAALAEPPETGVEDAPVGEAAPPGAPEAAALHDEPAHGDTAVHDEPVLREEPAHDEPVLGHDEDSALRHDEDEEPALRDADPALRDADPALRDSTLRDSDLDDDEDFDDETALYDVEGEFDDDDDSVESDPLDGGESHSQHGRGGDTPAQGFAALDEDDLLEDEGERDDTGDNDVLEDTPDFLQETPEHDRLWFEQKPPRDFDFD